MSALLCACGHHVTAHTHVPAHEAAFGRYCRACACVGFTPPREGLDAHKGPSWPVPKRDAAGGLLPFAVNVTIAESAALIAEAAALPPAIPADPNLLERCPTHGVPLVHFCPACRGTAGGKATSPQKAKASRQNAETARAMRKGTKSSP